MPLQWAKLTTNGEQVVCRRHRDGEVVVLVNGDFGGGTLTFGYRNVDGNFQPFASTQSVTEDVETAVILANGVQFMANVTGATSPDINVGISADFLSVDF